MYLSSMDGIFSKSFAVPLAEALGMAPATVRAGS